MENKQYAGFWIRVVASLIDTILVVVLTAIPITLIYGATYWEGEQYFYGIWDILINYLAPFILVIWFWVRFYATPGKMLLNLKVLDVETGEGLTVMQAIGRYFAYFVSIIPLFHYFSVCFGSPLIRKNKAGMTS